MLPPQGPQWSQNSPTSTVRRHHWSQNPPTSGLNSHLQSQGWEIDPEDLAHISPYLTEHINRFGEYSTHEVGIQPQAYDPTLDIDFTPLREQDRITAGLGQAA
ncbi:Tn3 family transposase [Streptomyces phaeochromogenes]